MIKHRIKKNIGVLSGICLMFLAVISCTKDYFLDETTFWVHVPQLEEASTDKLSNLYVFFHSAKENHVVTRKVDAITLKEAMLDKGVLRFKLPPAHGYTVSSIANTQNYLVDGGKMLSEAFVSAEPWEDLPASGTAYKTLGSKGIRILSQNPVTVFPINHPDGRAPHEIDMNETTEYGSKVSFEFISLPTAVNLVEVEYHGLATHYSLYSGTFTHIVPTDYYLSKTLIAEMGAGTTKRITHNVFPSDGASVHANSTGGEQPINLIIRFYDANGNVIFVHNLDQQGYPAYAIDGVVYPKWDPIMGADLKPQIKIKNRDHLTVTFKDWTVVGITLQGWGDIVDGEPTPM